MLSFAQVKENPLILEFIRKSDQTLVALLYTDHGLRHLNLVVKRARYIAKSVGLNKREEELAAIASFCHDMGNFLSRSHHNYFGALLFCQVFQGKIPEKELTTIMQAISNHDKQLEDINFVSPISAVVVLADKSDVERSRVIKRDLKQIKLSIHDRVNYATTKNRLEINQQKRRITLNLRIDTNFVPIMEYFEIFTDRMIFCRKAAEFLNYQFGLVINKTRLL